MGRHHGGHRDAASRDKTGLGWTYSAGAAAGVIRNVLATVVEGRSAFDIPAGWAAMHHAGRNLGTKGLVMQALSAVDIAWWDLKARLLDVSLSGLFGRCRREIPVQGSGGSMTCERCCPPLTVCSWT